MLGRNIRPGQEIAGTGRYDLEVLDASEVADTIVDEVAKLQAFYEQAADAGLGVVMYTT